MDPKSKPRLELLNPPYSLKSASHGNWTYESSFLVTCHQKWHNWNDYRQVSKRRSKRKTSAGVYSFISRAKHSDQRGLIRLPQDILSFRSCLANSIQTKSVRVRRPYKWTTSRSLSLFLSLSRHRLEPQADWHNESPTEAGNNSGRSIHPFIDRVDGYQRTGCPLPSPTRAGGGLSAATRFNNHTGSYWSARRTRSRRHGTTNFFNKVRNFSTMRHTCNLFIRCHVGKGFTVLIRPCINFSSSGFRLKQPTFWRP